MSNPGPRPWYSTPAPCFYPWCPVRSASADIPPPTATPFYGVFCLNLGPISDWQGQKIYHRHYNVLYINALEIVAWKMPLQ